MYLLCFGKSDSLSWVNPIGYNIPRKEKNEKLQTVQASDYKSQCVVDRSIKNYG